MKTILWAVPAIFLAVPAWANDTGGEDLGDGFRNTDELIVPHDDGSGIMHYDVEPVAHAPRLPKKIETMPQIINRHFPKHAQRHGASKKSAHKTKATRSNGTKGRKVSLLAGHPKAGDYGQFHVAGPKPYPYKHYPFARPNMHPKGSGQRF